MFDILTKRKIAREIQWLLRETKDPELPIGEIQFQIHVEGKDENSWADIVNNGAIDNK